MTSARFEAVALDSIHIEREQRQRRELPKLEELAASIANIGLINPIVITSDFILVAGERRLEACRSLGWTQIPVQYVEDLDPLTLHLIELEENIKRSDLTWQDQNTSIARYWELRRQAEPNLPMNKVAGELNISKGTLTNHLLVNRARTEGNEDVEKAERMSTALGLAERARDRQKDSALRDIAPAPETRSQDPAEPATEAGPAVTRYAAIHTADFLEWARKKHHPFNLIHCDFPYGVDTGDKKGQSAAKRLGTYEDGEDIYWALLDTMLQQQDNFIAPSAHLIFWFSMKFYKPTVDRLEAAGWSVDPFPLIWLKSDNAGIIPDRNRGGRRVYETALFASRGDRKIVRPVSNAIAAATTKDYHTSEKPAAVLEHFFRMLLDGSTRLLDPTCGSGMAVKVAEASGAAYALGLEQNEEFAYWARENCGL